MASPPSRVETGLPSLLAQRLLAPQMFPQILLDSLLIRQNAEARHLRAFPRLSIATRAKKARRRRAAGKLWSARGSAQHWSTGEPRVGCKQHNPANCTFLTNPPGYVVHLLRSTKFGERQIRRRWPTRLRQRCLTGSRVGHFGNDYEFEARGQVVILVTALPAVSE